MTTSRYGRATIGRIRDFLVRSEFDTTASLFLPGFPKYPTLGQCGPDERLYDIDSCKNFRQRAATCEETGLSMLVISYDARQRQQRDDIPKDEFLIKPSQVNPGVHAHPARQLCSSIHD